MNYSYDNEADHFGAYYSGKSVRHYFRLQLLTIALTWVAEHFSAEPALFKRKHSIHFRNIEFPEYFKCPYVQFFFIMILLRPWN